MTTNETPDPVFPSLISELHIEILYEKDVPLIVGVKGYTTITELDEIERDLCESDKFFFNSGDGHYLLTADWEKPQYGEYGRIEIHPYWDFKAIAYMSIENYENMREKLNSQ